MQAHRDIEAARPAAPEPTAAELERIRAIVYERSGITLHEGKRQLVTARLHRRLRELGLSSYGDYLRALDRDTSGQELTTLLDAISTNFTSFFREPQHFAFLREQVFPELRQRGRPDPRVWCAAAATGEEPYTLAMTFVDGGFQPRILASDISTKALAAATRAVYPAERARTVPPIWLPRYFEKGRGTQEGQVRIVASLRERIEFRRLNLLEIQTLEHTFPVIFCRNVMIYFDIPTRQRVVSMLERHLEPGGSLFVSHSESLTGITHGLRWAAPAVYRKGAA